MPTRPGFWYAMDFVHDRLANGRRFKCLTMTDPYSKEVLVIEIDGWIGRERVCRILDRVFARRSMQEVLILDNGTEFAGNALDTWAVSIGSRCISSNRGSRSKMHLLRVLTAGFGVSA
jgi:putative transposase